MKNITLSNQPYFNGCENNLSNNDLTYSVIIFVIGSLALPISVSLLLPALMFNGLLT